MGSDLAADVEPVTPAGQPDIENHDPGALLLEDLETPLTVGGQEHPIALPPQVEVHQVRDVGVVLHHDDRPVFRAHAPSLPPAAPRIAGMGRSFTEP